MIGRDEICIAHKKGLVTKTETSKTSMMQTTQVIILESVTSYLHSFMLAGDFSEFLHLYQYKNTRAMTMLIKFTKLTLTQLCHGTQTSLFISHHDLIPHKKG